MRAPGSECQTGTLALFSKKDSLWDALLAPQAGGNRFENWTGTAGLQAAGIPCPFALQALAECLRCATHGQSAVDSAPKCDE